MPMDDNVDTSLIGAGSYFHSRSFDEIVDNVFSGDGSTCGMLANTGNSPPTIDVTLDPTSLWPPNHMMTPITATVVAEDNCPGVSFVLSSLTSDEPDNGTGDGDTINDIQDADIGTPDISFSLRSERAGGGDGRVYTATYTAMDGSGNDAEDSATVTVPKSQKDK